MTPLKVCFCKLFLKVEGTDTLHLASILFTIVDKNKAIKIPYMGYYGILWYFQPFFNKKFSIANQMACKPDSVPYKVKAVTINLGLMLPSISSILPYPLRRATHVFQTGFSWTCSQRGLQYHSCYQACGKLLPYLFTLTVSGGIFSLALSLGLPPPEVIRLWCSDESGLSSLKGSHTAIQLI